MASQPSKKREGRNEQAQQTRRARIAARGRALVPHPVTKGQAIGAPRKVSLSARASLEQAFKDMGGVPGFVRWGRKNPTEFYRIWARLIPKDVTFGADAGLEELLTKLAESRGISDARPTIAGEFTLVDAELGSCD